MSGVQSHKPLYPHIHTTHMGICLMCTHKIHKSIHSVCMFAHDICSHKAMKHQCVHAKVMFVYVCMFIPVSNAQVCVGTCVSVCMSGAQKVSLWHTDLELILTGLPSQDARPRFNRHPVFRASSLLSML